MVGAMGQSRARESPLWKVSARCFHSNFPVRTGIFQMIPSRPIESRRPNRANHLFANSMLSSRPRPVGRHPGGSSAPFTLRNTGHTRNLSRFPTEPILFCHEKDLPTQSQAEKAPARLPSSHAHPRRSGDTQESSPKGPKASRCLNTCHSATHETFVESSSTGIVVAAAVS